MLSVCLAAGAYGHRATGVRGCKNTALQPQRAEETCRVQYPTPCTVIFNNLFTFASRWHSLYVWLVHNFPKCREWRWDVLCPCVFHGPPPFTRLTHSKGLWFQLDPYSKGNWKGEEMMGRNVPRWQEGHVMGCREAGTATYPGVGSCWPCHPTTVPSAPTPQLK